MNERIKELIKSLGIIPEDEHYEVAELIVRECISAVDSTPLGYSDYRDQIEEAMRNACSQAIRNTFGVEE